MRQEFTEESIKAALEKHLQLEFSHVTEDVAQKMRDAFYQSVVDDARDDLARKMSNLEGVEATLIGKQIVEFLGVRGHHPVDHQDITMFNTRERGVNATKTHAGIARTITRMYDGTWLDETKE